MIKFKNPNNPIFPEFENIIKKKSNELILFECGASDGSDTHDMIHICLQNHKKYKYYAFEADPRIMPDLKFSTRGLSNVLLIENAIASYHDILFRNTKYNQNGF